ncbi:MAG: glycosyltransferase family 2 protein [Acidobacteria bacterium]|nr:glycosyltransferase family 2 protein [Acidobacteriota bacterium]
MKRLSVCLTTYNRARLLDRTLGSLAAQTRLPDELIVSDDCSTDDTAAVAERWRSAFPTYIYRRNPRNLYMPGNLNACLAEATGDYIANLHDADEFDAALLQKWEAALDAYPSAGFVFCGVSAGDPHGVSGTPDVVRLNRSTLTYRYPRTTVYLHDVEPLTPGREFFERHMLHATYSIVWATVMARRDAYERLLPYDPQCGWVSDVDMWMRMCLHFDVAYVREPLLHLDASPTAERRFDWNREEALRRIQRVNIERSYGYTQDRLAHELTRYRRLYRGRYARKITALAARGELAKAATGIGLLLRGFR